jgi:nucleoid-associated protein YgaU
MSIFLKNENDVIQARKYIEILDKAIATVDNNIIKETDQETITALQEFLDRLRNKRRGYIQLIVIYHAENEVNNQLNIVTVEEDCTLVDYANANYGINDFWQQIYEANNLTSPMLTTGQQLIIPELESEPEKILYQKIIIPAEVITLVFEELGL